MFVSRETKLSFINSLVAQDQTDILLIFGQSKEVDGKTISEISKQRHDRRVDRGTGIPYRQSHPEP